MKAMALVRKGKSMRQPVRPLIFDSQLIEANISESEN